MRKPTRYLVYRHGANASNQPMTNVRPVAVVEANSRDAACATERHDPPGKLDPYAPATMVLDREITVWANQYLSAIPVSKAPRADLRAVGEVA